MAFQYPVAIPGVTVAKYLRMVVNAHREARGEPEIKLKDFRKDGRGRDGARRTSRASSRAATSTTASRAARRSGWRSCSWRCCSPKLAVLDETDSGPRHRRAADRRRRRQHVRRARHGRPDHHPLPAHPAPGEARLRPRHVRGADRQGGRPRARRARSRSRATAGSARRSRRPRRRGGFPMATASVTSPARLSLDREVRAAFPTLEREVNGQPLAYLDNGASAQTPLAVIEAVDRYWTRAQRERPPRRPHALGRGDGRLRGRAGDDRRPPRRGRPPRGRSSSATRPRRSTWSPSAWGRANVGAGDRIVLTEMEHHSNIVPWQQLAEAGRRGDRLGAGRRRRAARHGRPSTARWSAARSWSPSPTSRTSSAPSTRSPRSPGSPTRPARSCSSTARRRRRSCRSTWPSWASTSTRSPATSSTAPTGIGALWAGSSCCARCRRSWAAAR